MKIFCLKNLLLFSIVFLFSLNSYAVENNKVIKIALSAENPPNSYLKNGVLVGMFREILELLFSKLPNHRAEFHAFPWTRAQIEVKYGKMDMMLTFPSESRKVYAAFTKSSLFVWDYGNLAFNTNNPKKSQIEKAKSFADLKGLVFISQDGVEWEKENVPPYIKRTMVNNIRSMMSQLLNRNSGDFIIISPEQARYYAQNVGQPEKLQMKKVDFIPNSKVNFHIGIRKTYNGYESILSEVESVIHDPDFQKKKSIIEKKYTDMLK